MQKIKIEGDEYKVKIINETKHEVKGIIDAHTCFVIKSEPKATPNEELKDPDNTIIDKGLKTNESIELSYKIPKEKKMNDYYVYVSISHMNKDGHSNHNNISLDVGYSISKSPNDITLEYDESNHHCYRTHFEKDTRTLVYTIKKVQPS